MPLKRQALIRIERTGCLYIPRTDAMDYKLHPAITTDIYAKLKEYIMN
jgi:hypothetical protein